jgi:hypothetical protein
MPVHICITYVQYSQAQRKALARVFSMKTLDLFEAYDANLDKLQTDTFSSNIR